MEANKQYSKTYKMFEIQELIVKMNRVYAQMDEDEARVGAMQQLRIS